MALIGAGCAAVKTLPPPSNEPWISRLSLDHPLIGKIWSLQDQTFVERTQVEARLKQARFVLLGEKHDNPDHHRLQAAMVSVVASSGRKPAVVFEMLARSLQPRIDEHLKTAPGDVDGLGRAVDWDHSGWPAWITYRPIFASIMNSDLVVVAAALPRKEARQIARGQLKLPDEFMQRYRLDVPFPNQLQDDLLAELDKGHCGYLGAEMLEPMALVQRTRDALMADKLIENAGTDGAILIAGGGHVRIDRGVPWYLKAARNDIVTIGFREVDDGLKNPADYEPQRQPPFDYLWFTPRANDVDHCEQLKQQMKKIKTPQRPSSESLNQEDPIQKAGKSD